MKMNYTDEESWKSEDVEINDQLYDIAKELHDKHGNYGPVILRKDKKSLSFGINKAIDRVERERGDNLYRITIEKVI